MVWESKAIRVCPECDTDYKEDHEVCPCCGREFTKRYKGFDMGDFVVLEKHFKVVQKELGVVVGFHEETGKVIVENERGYWDFLDVRHPRIKPIQEVFE